MNSSRIVLPPFSKHGKMNHSIHHSEKLLWKNFFLTWKLCKAVEINRLLCCLAYMVIIHEYSSPRNNPSLASLWMHTRHSSWTKSNRSTIDVDNRIKLLTMVMKICSFDEYKTWPLAYVKWWSIDSTRRDWSRNLQGEGLDEWVLFSALHKILIHLFHSKARDQCLTSRVHAVSYMQIEWCGSTRKLSK